jgi:GAF domain
VSHYTDDSDAAILPAHGGVTTISKRTGPNDPGDGGTAASPDSRYRCRGCLRESCSQADAGHRALLGVPLLSEDEVGGVLAVTRKTPGEFDPEVIRLLSTFANQSALAIQNARLFQDIEEKSRQLEVASQHKSEPRLGRRIGGRGAPTVRRTTRRTKPLPDTGIVNLPRLAWR